MLSVCFLYLILMRRWGQSQHALGQRQAQSESDLHLVWTRFPLFECTDVHCVSESCCSSGVHRAALFQELLSRRSSIPLHNQELLYEGRRLVLDPNRQAKTFPKTCRDNPIMLVSRESVATVGLIFEDRAWFCSAHAWFSSHSDSTRLSRQFCWC